MVAPPLAMLGLGWFFVLIEFGKTHTDFVQVYTTLGIAVYVNNSCDENPIIQSGLCFSRMKAHAWENGSE